MGTSLAGSNTERFKASIQALALHFIVEKQSDYLITLIM